MFGFEKSFKKKSAGISELPVVIDMELLDKALNMAIDNYMEANKKTREIMMMPADKSEALADLERLRLDLFAFDVKINIAKLSERE